MAGPDEESTREPRVDRLGGVFYRFWSAATSSNLADGMLLTAMPLVGALLTDDPLLISGLVAARFLPWLLFGPLSGVLVDRVDRAQAMTAAAALRATTMGTLAVLVAMDLATIWVLYAAMFLIMSGETVYDIGARSLLPRLVRAHQLDRANSRLEGGRVVTEDCAGAPLAGLLFATAAALPLASAAGAYAVAALLLLGIPLSMRRPPAPEGTTDGPPPVSRRSVGQSLLDGIRYVLGTPILRGLLMLNVTIMLSLQMGIAVLVLFAQQRLGVPASLYGVFLAAMAMGAFLGATCVSRLVATLGRAAVIRSALLGMAGAMLAFGLAPNAYAGALCLGLFGFAITTTNVANTVILQTMIPDELRGRTIGAYRMLGWGLAPIGALTGGLLGRLDLSLPYVAGASLALLAVLTLWSLIGRAAHLANEMGTARPAGDAA